MIPVLQMRKLRPRDPEIQVEVPRVQNQGLPTSPALDGLGPWLEGQGEAALDQRESAEGGGDVAQEDGAPAPRGSSPHAEATGSHGLGMVVFPLTHLAFAGRRDDFCMTGR